MRRAFLLLFAFAFGCTRSEGRDAGEDFILPEPVAVYDIGAGSVEPLEFSAVLSWTTDTILVAERRSGEIWSMVRRESDIDLHRLFGFPTPTRVVALERAGKDLLLLTKDFRVYRFAAHNQADYRVVDLSPPANSTLLRAIGLGHGRFALLVNRLGEGAILSEVMVVTPDALAPRVLEGLDRSITASGGKSQFDFRFLAAGRDSLYLTGTNPPRILAWELDGLAREGAPAAAMLARFDIRLRPVPEVVHQRVSQQFRAAGLDGASMKLPDWLPAPIAMQPLTDGLAVVATTAHQDGDGRALDLYCQGHFRRTLLSAPDVVQIYLTERWALVFRAIEPTTYRLEMHELSTKNMSCGYDG